MNINEITTGKVKSFLQGYTRYYFDNIFGLPDPIKEQVFFRLFTCKNSCLPQGKCEICKCPTIQRAYSSASCNPEKFPDMLSVQEWEAYKIENNITGLDEMRRQVELLISNTDMRDE
jgi:hypothetical protein